MSYTSIPNQPILFNSTLPQPCEGCNNEFTQLADFNDELFWQLEAGVCGYTQFDSVISNINCTIDSGVITFADPTPPSGVVLGYKKFINCLEYKVTLTIDYGCTGSLTVGFTNGTSVELTTPGTHVFYLKATDIAANNNSNIQDLILASTAPNPFLGVVTIVSFEPNCNGALFAGIVDAETLAVVQVLDPVITTSDQYLTFGNSRLLYEYVRSILCI